jgi:hypothetical protein
VEFHQSGRPGPQGRFLDASGVFLKKTSEEEAKALALVWFKPRAEHAQPNVKGIGVA